MVENELKMYAVAKIEGIKVLEVRNGIEVSDLETMVQFFHANPRPRIPLKLPQEQALRIFGQTDGAPALGWVSRIYREGKKLLADFRKVPTVVASTLREGSPKITAEVRHDFRDPDGRRWRSALWGVVVDGVPFTPWGNLNEMQTALFSEGASRRSEEPSIDELTRCRVALTGEPYAVGVRQVLRTHPEAARVYLRIGQGPEVGR